MKWYHKTGLALLGLAGIWWGINQWLSILQPSLANTITVVLALVGLFMATGGKIFGSLFH